MTNICGSGDARHMARALFLAERGRGRTTPNPLVGAVIVSPEGIVVGQGAHLEAGGPHAEIHALEMAGQGARGATLYVTLEPCCHVGRTGPCVERIVSAGIARVVVAMRDPNPRVNGGGVAYLRGHGISVVENVGVDDARRLNAPFLSWMTRRRPFVTLKIAKSADGFAGRTNARVRLTGEIADRWFHRQRAEVDAIAVGARTVVVDNPRLTARGAYRARPLTRVVIDWRLRTPPAAAIYSTADVGPVIMIVDAGTAASDAKTISSIENRGVTVEPVAGRDLRVVLERLAAREILSLLVEGGPALGAALAAAGLVDRVQWVRTPRMLGADDAAVPAMPAELSDLILIHPPRLTTLGDDLLFEFDVHRTD